MTDVLFLSNEDVSGLAEQSAFVEVVREAYRQRGTGAPAKPRTALRNTEPPGLFTTYAAILPETGVMGGYMYSAGFEAGDAWFVTPLFDAESGELLTIVDGASMNPFKTGATGAVGVDSLARDDASVLAIFGSQTQAKAQLRATATVRDLSEVRVYSPTDTSREAFAETMTDTTEAPITPVSSPAAALDGADIVITATDASDPVFDGSDLEPGTHVTAMGQYDPNKYELDATTLERSVYVPDLEARVLQDAGSFLNALKAGVIEADHVHAELGAVVAGEAPGRTTADQITVFDSGGTGIETTAGAFLLYERAREAGLGTTIEFAPASEAFLE
ncbi:ornithine cyclodeaminase family protein [Halodesulfurarchaeum sp.]|uniref:ornithine cyclodeaminase family protein n=1 Tax=Halodesulfurarchaeum sp. TaxID=1980530 RepID=UPI002FC2F60F